jgi:hypothetical protein
VRQLFPRIREDEGLGASEGGKFTIKLRMIRKVANNAIGGMFIRKLGA